MERPIYLDYNATTPTDPLVTEAMLPYLKEKYGNASSTSHAYGWEASQAVSLAREQVASLINCEPSEIYFTSGATESNNLAIQGVILPLLLKGEKPHLITSLIEHKAVVDVAEALEKYGAQVTYLKPDPEGRISPQQVLEALRPETKLISLFYGQNEIGSINPVAEITQALSEKKKDQKFLFHTDAAQVVGKHPVDLSQLDIDLLSASGQKIYGPKGVGFLYIKKDIKDDISPLMYGGSQESGIRPGTLNVPGIVGLGKACELCEKALSTELPRLQAFQKRLIEEVTALSPETIILNGPRVGRLCSNVSFSFKNLSSDLFALGLSGLAVSSASACSAGAPSHVLSALGHDEALSRSTLRIGLGRYTEESDIDLVIQKVSGLLDFNKSL